MHWSFLSCKVRPLGAANKLLIIEKFASIKEYSPSEHPVIIFTAGSPGAGKTEFIKGFRQSLEQVQKIRVVVIDPDAVRELLPGYTGANSYLFQRAISIAVDDLFRHVMKNNKSAFVDGTLSDYNRAYQNINTVIEKYGLAMVCFVFQDPKTAWHFTQLREAVEGRNIKQKNFIDRFLGAKETVERIKSHFGDKLILNVILKDYKDTKENKAVAKVYNNVTTVEECFHFDYTKETLERILA